MPSLDEVKSELGQAQYLALKSLEERLKAVEAKAGVVVG